MCCKEKNIQLKDSFGMPEEFISNGCNGAGSGWNEKLVPDTIYGVNIRPAACIHDYAYLVGKTIEDKQHADREFLNNLLRLIEANNKWYYPTMLARRRALKYYESVVAFGGTAFWDGKKK